MAQDPRIGTEIAGYRIESVLGRGGMSVVYLAEHKRLGRRVALKFLSGELAQDEDFRARFEQEWRAAAAIDHPNVVPIYEAGEADGALYIAMRHVGGSLRSLIAREKQLDPARTILIVAQVASALDAAHRNGLVHRDIKPGNILIAPAMGDEGEDHVYLADFGLTKSTTQASGLTRVGHFVGTLDYVAPEQIEGKEIDARVDIYALGCVMYECLVGTPPYPRESEVAIMHAHLREPPPSILAKRPDVPAGLDAVLAKAMAKEPDDRYETARAMAVAARSAIREAYGSDFAPTATTPGFRREPGDPTPPRGTPTGTAEIPVAPLSTASATPDVAPDGQAGTSQPYPDGASVPHGDGGAVGMPGAPAPWVPTETAGWVQGVDPAAQPADAGYGGGAAYGGGPQYDSSGGAPYTGTGAYPAYGGAPGYGGGDAWSQGSPGYGAPGQPGGPPVPDRRPLIIGAVIVGVLVVAVGTAFAVLGGSGPTPTPFSSPIARASVTPPPATVAPTARATPTPTRAPTAAPTRTAAAATPISVTADHETILAAIPAGFRDGCFPSVPSGDATAAILCSEPSVLFISYSLYETEVALDSAFDSTAAIFAEDATGASCAEGPSRGDYDQGDTEDVGRFICYDLAGNATMLWTHDNLRILAQTSVEGRDWEALSEFWGDAGPTE